MKATLLKISIVCVAAILFIVGCDGLAEPDPVHYETMWQNMKVTDYTIEQNFVCECLQRAALLHVVKDSIVEATYIADGKPVPAEYVQHYKTIDQLYREIENFSGDSIVVEFNEAQNYPEMVSIEPQRQPIDGGVIINTSNLKIK